MNRKSIAVGVLISSVLMTSHTTFRDNLHFRNISTDSGLSDNMVLAIEKDKYGFLWIGTSEGLNRYDGYRFDVYRNRPDDTTSLSSSFINALYLDSRGGLLVGTEMGLNIYDYDTDSFRKVRAANDSLNLLSTLRIRSIHEYRGTIYLGSLEGLMCLDRNTKYLSFFKLTADRNEMANEILCMTHDRYGMLWLGTYDGLYKYNPADNSFERYDARRKEKGDIANNLINALYIPENSPDLLYIGGPSGLMVYDVRNPGTEISSLRASDGDMDDEIKTITKYDDDTIILGTENGLTLYRTATGEHKTFYNSLYNETSLPSNHIKTSYLDTGNGIIWAGTEHGLACLDLNKKKFDFTPLTTENEHYSRHKFTVYDTDVWKDGIWLASRDGIRRIGPDGEEKNYNLKDGLSHRICKSLFRDSRGTLWIGTNNGLDWYDESEDRFHKVLPDTNCTMPLKYIYSITEDSDHDIVTNISSGLLFISPERRHDGSIGNFAFRSVSIKDIINSYNCDIGYIEADSRGGIWFSATMNGLFHYDKRTGRIQNFRTIINDQSSIVSNRVYSIYADRNDDIWIGTDLGLCCYLADEGHFVRFDDIDLKQPVRMIISDNKDRLWLATINKLIMYNPKTEEKIVCDLHADFGLDEIMYNSASTSIDGEFWFGGNGGVVSFMPDNITISNSAAPLVIRSFYLWNKEVLPGKIFNGRTILHKSLQETRDIILEHDENSLSIGFSMLNYSSTGNKYMYMLKGYDKNFNTVSSYDKLASYTNLSPGRYVFYVKACNSDNIWSDDVPCLYITIRQPVLLRWWAWCIYALAAAGLASLTANFIRARMKLSDELKMEKIERTKLEELNETKMQFFTNVSHDFKTPLSLILGPLENLISAISDKDQLKQLRILQDNANILLRLINQIMDIRKIESGKTRLNPERGDIVAFAQRVFKSFDPMARSRGIQYEFISTVPALQTDFDSDKMEKILYNLVSNAFKFTPSGSGRISLSISLETSGSGSSAVFKVEDNGCGISKEDQAHVFEQFWQSGNKTCQGSSGTGIGLTIVNDFVRLHGGHIYVDSAPGKGSTFTFSIPAVTEDIDECFDNAVTDSIRVLVVEDNKDMQDFICMILKKKYETFTAADGNEGYSKAKSINPDIVISDIMMPGMDGYMLCRKLKSEMFTSHIPVILLTASNDEESRIEAYRSLADGYICKPFSVKTLLAKVGMLVVQRRKLQEKYRIDLLSNPSEINPESDNDKFLDTVIKAIEDNMDNSEFGIQDLCDITRWSHQQIYRKIHALTGESINEFIRTVRLKRAAQLLSVKNCRVSEVMYKVGFSSHSYFTRSFKEKFGMSPKEYAETQQKK